jgi:hypothetical protein
MGAESRPSDVASLVSRGAIDSARPPEGAPVPVLESEDERGVDGLLAALRALEALR